MEEYEKNRPRKTAFPRSERERVLEKAKDFVLKDLLPNQKINRIFLFGSLAKGKFGKYEKPFKNRWYSDIDILVFVEDDFKIPRKWKLHAKCDLYKVYNICKLERRFLVQYMICRKSSYQKKENQKEAENWGVPLLLEKSRHKYITLK